MKYLKRLLGLPFFMALQIIAMIFYLCKVGYYFMIYGGEAIVYEKESRPKMISDIYYKISEEIKTKKEQP